MSVSIIDLNDLEMNVFRQGQFLNVRGEKTSEQTFYYTLTTTASDIWREDDVTLRDYCCVESGIAADLLSKCAHSAIIPAQLFKYLCTCKYVTNSSFGIFSDSGSGTPSDTQAPYYVVFVESEGGRVSGEHSRQVSEHQIKLLNSSHHLFTPSICFAAGRGAAGVELRVPIVPREERHRPAAAEAGSCWNLQETQVGAGRAAQCVSEPVQSAARPPRPASRRVLAQCAPTGSDVRRKRDRVVGGRTRIVSGGVDC